MCKWLLRTDPISGESISLEIRIHSMTRRHAQAMEVPKSRWTNAKSVTNVRITPHFTKLAFWFPNNKIIRDSLIRTTQFWRFIACIRIVGGWTKNVWKIVSQPRVGIWTAIIDSNESGASTGRIRALITQLRCVVTSWNIFGIVPKEPLSDWKIARSKTFVKVKSLLPWTMGVQWKTDSQPSRSKIISGIIKSKWSLQLFVGLTTRWPQSDVSWTFALTTNQKFAKMRRTKRWKNKTNFATNRTRGKIWNVFRSDSNQSRFAAAFLFWTTPTSRFISRKFDFFEKFDFFSRKFDFFWENLIFFRENLIFFEKIWFFLKKFDFFWENLIFLRKFWFNDQENLIILKYLFYTKFIY